jgi:hypothetical protein
MFPAINNWKSSNERAVWGERARMFAWLGSTALASDAELDVEPHSVWAEAMLAEGFNQDGYLVASDGLANDDRTQPAPHRTGAAKALRRSTAVAVAK